jgi:NADH dehydrogenase (ubiquinone) 1 alpha subcomplex subunit 6
MHWFKRYDDPAPPHTFLDKFYAGRDDPKQVSSF